MLCFLYVEKIFKIIVFAVASLLSCLHQLRAENLRLEEHVSSLLQRRDHLLAVNARLAIPLTGQPALQQAHPHTGMYTKLIILHLQQEQKQ